MPEAQPPSDRFWLLVGEVPAGPFTVAQVHGELAAGRATWQTPACPVGGSAWLPLVRTPGIGPTAPQRIAAGTRSTDTHPSSTPFAAAPSPGEPSAGNLEGVFGAKHHAPASLSPSNTDSSPSSSSTAPTDTSPDRPPGDAAGPTANGTGRPGQPNRFWLLVGAETTGPFRAAHIRAKLRSGELRPDAKARRVGTEEWVSLTEVVGALPPRDSAAADARPARGVAVGPPAPHPPTAESRAPSGGGAATPVEVRCGCGRLVRADRAFAGQPVQCPHCKAAVAVPVAPAAAEPPAPPPAGPRRLSFWDTENGRMLSMIGGFILLTMVVGYIKGCREDAEKNRPSMGEIMQKARDKGR